jgi:hypothetical protein
MNQSNVLNCGIAFALLLGAIVSGTVHADEQDYRLYEHFVDDPFQTVPLKGPYPSLTNYCSTLKGKGCNPDVAPLERPSSETSVHGNRTAIQSAVVFRSRQELHPEHVALPYETCALGIRTAAGWFVGAEAQCQSYGMPLGPLGRFETGLLEFGIHDTNAGPIVMAVFQTFYEERIRSDKSGQREYLTNAWETLLACGLNPQRVPKCTAPIPLRIDSHSVGVKRWPDGTLEFTRKTGRPQSQPALRSVLGRRRIQF